MALAGCVASRPPIEAAPELVVLVHGMGRTSASMAPMAWALRRAGYRTLRVSYRSTRGATVETAGREVAAAVAREQARHPAPRVHFVGHSLGGIAIRWMLAHAPPPNVGRAVLIAAPNQGSRAADRWTSTLGRWQTPMRELRTPAHGGTVAALPPPPPGVDVAVVAGAHDGKVSVREARLDGARASVVVPGTHTWLMGKPSVQRRVVRFLRTGDL